MALRSAMMAVREPVEVRRRLRGEPELEEGVERERGVAQPCEPVVPVALSADVLREARRGRSDDRSGRCVGHELQRERRSPDMHLVRAVVVHLTDPAPPVALALPEQLTRSLDAPRLGTAGAGRAGVERERRRLGGPEDERVVGAVELDRRAHDRDGASRASAWMWPFSTLSVTGVRANPGAGSKTWCMVISPARHSTRRITRGRLCGLACWTTLRSSTGMKSVTTTTPVPGREDGVEEVGPVAIALMDLVGLVGMELPAPTLAPHRGSGRTGRRCRSAAGRASRCCRRPPPAPRSGSRRSAHRPRSADTRRSARAGPVRPLGSARLVLVLGTRVIVILVIAAGRRILGVGLEGAHPELAEIVLGVVGHGAADDLLAVVVERARVDLA